MSLAICSPRSPASLRANGSRNSASSRSVSCARYTATQSAVSEIFRINGSARFATAFDPPTAKSLQKTPPSLVGSPKEKAPLFARAVLACGLLGCAVRGCFGLALPFGRLRGSLGFSCYCRFCLLRFAGRQVRSGEALAVECDLSNSYRGKRLPMSINLLVLLLALEMEDQNLVRAAAFHDLAADHCACARADGALLAGNGKNVIELNGIAVSGGALFQLFKLPRCDAVLFPPGANYRVHNSLHRPFKALGRKGLILTCKIASQPCSTGRNIHQWQTL